MQPVRMRYKLLSVFFDRLIAFSATQVQWIFTTASVTKSSPRNGVKGVPPRQQIAIVVPAISSVTCSLPHLWIVEPGVTLTFVFAFSRKQQEYRSRSVRSW
jgi:hypothetical protein